MRCDVRISVKVASDRWSDVFEVPMGESVTSLAVGRPRATAWPGIDRLVELTPVGIGVDDLPRVALLLRATAEPDPDDLDTLDADRAARADVLVVRAAVRASNPEWTLQHIAPDGRVRLHDRTCTVRMLPGHRYFVAEQLATGAILRYAELSVADDRARAGVLRAPAVGDAPDTTRAGELLEEQFSRDLRSIMFGAMGPATESGRVLAALLAIHTPELRERYRNPSLRVVLAKVGITSNHWQQSSRWRDHLLDREAPAGLSVDRYLGVAAHDEALTNYQRLVHIARALQAHRVVTPRDVQWAIERLR